MQIYEPCDPRVFFAAERTLLAWIRTGLTIMAFGFVVARFGLFLTMIGVQKSPHFTNDNFSDWSNILGLSMVILGVVCVFASVYQHRRYIMTIPHQDLPQYYNPKVAIGLAMVIGIAGSLVAVSLFILSR